MAKSEKPTRARTRPGGRKPGPNARGSRQLRKNQPSAQRRAGGSNNTKELAKQRMTEKRWTDYLAAIANGVPHREAAHSVRLTMQTVDAHLISNVAAAGQLRDAKMLWNRREWPMEQIEDVLQQIALGKTVRQAFDACGIDRKRIGSLYRLLLQDKALRKWYDEARELQAESYADDIIDISDETENDYTTNKDGKEVPNHEVINRSRLRVDSRKWLSAKWAPRRYGDTKHHLHEGELNINHAAILSGGRRRIEQLHAKRRGDVVDSTAEEVTTGNE